MLSDDELWKLWEANTEQPFPDYFVDFKRAAKVILAAHTAKLLAEVEMPEYKYIDRHDVPKEGMCAYTQDQLQSYAAAVAAQARMKALDDAVGICERFANRMMTAEECAAAIESLKGKV